MLRFLFFLEGVRQEGILRESADVAAVERRILEYEQGNWLFVKLSFACIPFVILLFSSMILVVISLIIHLICRRKGV